MFDVKDLFRWDQFITPLIIKVFYMLAVALVVLAGLSSILTGLTMMAISPFGGFLMILMSLVGTVVAVLTVRIACEFVLITFRINEHLGALRYGERR